MKQSQRIFLQRTLKLEESFRPKIISIIKSFRKDFIQDLQAHGQHTAVSNLQKKTIADKLTPLIQAIYKTAGLMGARLTAGEIKKQVSQKDLDNLYLLYKNLHWFPKGWTYQSMFTKAGFGRNDQWIRDVIKFLQIHMLGFVQDITDTMRDDILKILQKGIDEQLSIPEIVKNLQAEGLIQARAKVIARTEIIRAANAGHSVAAKSFPYEVNKKWSAANDSRTRHSHVYINNHMVDENDFFKVPIYKGDKNTGHFDEMSFPGDPNAHPSNTVNCRCRVVYEPKRDSAGNLILRDTRQAPVIPMRRPRTYDPQQIAAILKSNVTVGVK